MKKLLYFIFPFMVISVFSLSQDQTDYSNAKAIKRSMDNLFMNAQPKNWVIFTDTPALNQLQDGQVVLVSTTNKGIAWRMNNTVYFLTSSGALSSVTTNATYTTSNTYTTNLTQNISNNTYTTIMSTIANGFGCGYLWARVDGSTSVFQPSGVLFANDPYYDYDSDGNITAKQAPMFTFDSDGNVTPQ